MLPLPVLDVPGPAPAPLPGPLEVSEVSPPEPGEPDDAEHAVAVVKRTIAITERGAVIASRVCENRTGANSREYAALLVRLPTASGSGCRVE